MSKLAAGVPKPDPLREQLEELDVLMERMLALGVTRAGKESVRKPEPPPAPAPVESTAPPLEPASDQEPDPVPVVIESVPVLLQEDVLETEQPTDVLPDALLEFEMGSPAPLIEPMAEPTLRVEQPVDLALPAPTFVAMDIGPAAPAAQVFTDFQFAPPPSELALEAIEAPTPRPIVTVTETVEPLVFVAWWLRPLALVSGVYDGSTSWLGPIGRGLRSRPFKNLLGLCGLAALIGAMAWMAWENTDWNS